MSRFFGLLLFALVPAVPAAADPEPMARVVHTADLNLRTPQGIRRLHQRIGRAAESVCRAPNSAALVMVRYERKCIAEALQHVQPQVANLIQRSQQAQQLAGVAPSAVR